MHFDPDKPLILSCDASSVGIGAVLLHTTPEGMEQPIAFALRSLLPAERKYAQLQKEGLAIVFGVRRFHQFLWGRHFKIRSDHKPLKYLFSPIQAVPTMASARIQRWALMLGAYHYTVEYQPGKELGHADMLSRLPLPEAPSDVPLPVKVVQLMECLQSAPVSARQIKVWTGRDPTLSQVRDLVLEGGWTNVQDPSLQPYQNRKNELSVQDGCVLWGSRVVIPPPGRVRVTHALHESHPGIARMKALARRYVWWPGMDSDIEAKVKKCLQCQTNQRNPTPASIHPWEWPEHPWARLHADFAGPFMGHMFLLVVDARTKRLEVHPMKLATSQTTMEHLCLSFATHGLPETLVTDNGSVFKSA